MVAMQNDQFWYFIGVGADRGKPVVRVRRSLNGAVSTLAEAPLSGSAPIRLRITAHEARYDFAWSDDRRHWRSLVKDADGTILSTKKAGGFVGAVFGLYAHDGSVAGK